MALPNIQAASTPSYEDFPFFNYSTTVTILAGEAVSVDAANVIGGTNEGIGIVKCAADGNACVGIAMENIAPLTYGRVRTGGIAKSIADGAITANTIVDGSHTASKGVVAHGAGKTALGLALNTSADTEEVLVLISIALGA